LLGIIINMEDHTNLLNRAEQMLRYLRSELNAIEEKDFLNWLDEHPEQRKFMGKLQGEPGMKDELAFFDDTSRHAAWTALKKQAGNKPGTAPVARLWIRIAAAASVIIAIGTGILFYASHHHERELLANDIGPGKNTATLTLAGGKTINLSDTKTGVVIAASKITYNDGTAVKDAPAAGLQTINTPRGGTYQVLLPDGTKVWLNAASSFKFPSTFANVAERKVELSGEAYFEVAHNNKQPFLVKTGKQRVEVLGTHFNINSYTDEAETRTTLLEGSVRVTVLDRAEAVNPKSKIENMLVPGEQSILKDGMLSTQKADVGTEMAWKNGYFIFKNEDLHSIMRKISRWYNVDIVFSEDMPDIYFDGSISRFRNVSEVLRKFELTESVYFKIEGRRITVMP
jgi:transmembrane sensor